MELFNDTEMFAMGSAGRKTFDLPDAELLLIDGFFSKEESDRYYEILLGSTPWKEYEMPMYDKTVTAPRRIAWYQDKDSPGYQPGIPDWTPELLAIRERVQSEAGEKFNAVLLNLYRDGNDSVAWHSDKEGKSGKDPLIASVTFGEARLFKLRHKLRKDLPIVEIPLHHGSFMLMGGTTNSFWEHTVPKTARKILPRVNLTFRQVNRLP